MKAMRTKYDYLHSWYIERMYDTGMPFFTELTESEKETLSNTNRFKAWLFIEKVKEFIGSIIGR